MADHRRELAIAVLGGVLATGLALYAGTRHWQVDTIARPTPLPAKTISRSGTAIAPWLTATGWVALAGVGALLATRRVGRTIVSAVIAAAGLAIVAGGTRGITDDRWWWPALTLVAGVATAGVGVMALRRGRDWPSMGSRYDRVSSPDAAVTAKAGAPVTDADMWAALDRGDDPTSTATDGDG